MRSHAVVLWSKHGLLSRSDDSVKRAMDLIDYIETAAYYEWLDLSAGGRADGLTREDILEICRIWNVPQKVF
jgi:rhamnulose-1-phosphate aldolase